MLGVYEHDRDERDVPICWRLINDEYYPHFHAGIELAYILSGEMLITLGGKRQILHAGQGAKNRYNHKNSAIVSCTARRFAGIITAKGPLPR